MNEIQVSNSFAENVEQYASTIETVKATVPDLKQHLDRCTDLKLELKEKIRFLNKGVEALNALRAHTTGGIGSLKYINVEWMLKQYGQEIVKLTEKGTGTAVEEIVRKIQTDGDYKIGGIRMGDAAGSAVMQLTFITCLEKVAGEISKTVIYNDSAWENIPEQLEKLKVYAETVKKRIKNRLERIQYLKEKIKNLDSDNDKREEGLLDGLKRGARAAKEKIKSIGKDFKENRKNEAEEMLEDIEKNSGSLGGVFDQRIAKKKEKWEKRLNSYKSDKEILDEQMAKVEINVEEQLGTEEKSKKWKKINGVYTTYAMRTDNYRKLVKKSKTNEKDRDFNNKKFEKLLKDEKLGEKGIEIYCRNGFVKLGKVKITDLQIKNKKVQGQNVPYWEIQAKKLEAKDKTKFKDRMKECGLKLISPAAMTQLIERNEKQEPKPLKEEES